MAGWRLRGCAIGWAWWAGHRGERPAARVQPGASVEKAPADKPLRRCRLTVVGKSEMAVGQEE
jgi:hypothetical protein